MATRFEVSEVIRTSPERVFDTLLDLDGAHGWMPGLVRMEPLSAGALREGSEWRETRKLFGKEATEQFRVVGLERPRRLDLHVDGSKGSSGRGEYLFTYRLTRSDSGADVRLTGEIRGQTGLLGKLFARFFRKGCEKDLRALKAYLERDVAN